MWNANYFLKAIKIKSIKIDCWSRKIKRIDLKIINQERLKRMKKKTQLYKVIAWCHNKKQNCLSERKTKKVDIMGYGKGFVCTHWTLGMCSCTCTPAMTNGFGSSSTNLENELSCFFGCRTILFILPNIWMAIERVWSASEVAAARSTRHPQRKKQGRGCFLETEVGCKCRLPPAIQTRT